LGKKPIKKTKRNKKKDKKRSIHAGLEQATRLGLFKFFSLFMGQTTCPLPLNFLEKKLQAMTRLQ